MPVLLHKKKSDFKDSFLAGGGDSRPRNRCRPNSSFFSKSVFTLLCHLSSYNYMLLVSTIQLRLRNMCLPGKVSN